MSFLPNDTQIHKRIAQVRSRHMLPMEMLAFLMLMVGGITGAFGPGYLHQMLEDYGKSAEWGFALLPLASVGVTMAGLEWWFGYGWSGARLRHAIWLRMWLSGLAFIMWMYALYSMASLPGGGVTSVVVSAATVSPFHIWSWWVNYRVHCVLDPNLKTEKLGVRLETNRDRW